MVELDRDQREQPHRVDIARVVAQDAAIKPLGLVDASLAMMLGGVRHHAPFGRALEATLEGGIRFLAAAEQRECLAEREPGALERGIEPRRTLEEGQGIGRAARLHQQESQILRGLRERRSRVDDLAQQRFGFLAAIHLDEERAKQRLDVHVARILPERFAAARLGRQELAGIDEADSLVEYGLGRGRQRHESGQLPPGCD
jgi:hypothetical protein